MNNLYFKTGEGTTVEDLKRQYRELSKKYHPDAGTPEASSEAFQRMSLEYNRLLDEHKNPGNKNIVAAAKIEANRFLLDVLNLAKGRAIDLANKQFSGYINQNISDPLMRQAANAFLNKFINNVKQL